MDLKATIRRLGFTENHAAVYLAALELGETSITELSKRAVLKRPTTYLIIDDLQMQGLLSESKKGKRRVFSAAHPRRLLEITRSREKQTEEAMPELLALYNAPKEKPKIQVFEGVKGVQSVYEELYQSMSNKEEALWFTNIEALSSIPEAAKGFERMVGRLTNPKIRELIYGDNAGVKWEKDLEKTRGKNHFVRLLPTEYPFGETDTMIFGNKFVTVSLAGKIFTTVIESTHVAQTYRTMFEWAWKQGEEA